MVVPSGVRMPRQIAPSEVRRKVGSPAPRRCVDEDRADRARPVRPPDPDERCCRSGHLRRLRRATDRSAVGACRHNDPMLLAHLVDVSAQVAATRSRLAKRELIADLLREVAGAGGEEIDIAASYLSGTLRQRRTGLGWRSLADLPAPAAEPSVGLVEVDATLEEISALSGAGSMGARRDAVTTLFGRLTEAEQVFLRNLVTGNVRQGALDSVMLDAIAAAADLDLKAVRRAAMFSAPTGPIARAALTGGATRARGLQPARGQAGPADARRHRSRRRCRCRQGRGAVRRRHQAGRDPDPGAQARRRGGGVHPQPRRDRCPAARGRGRPPGRCRPPT